jgi:hypothetical protein
VLRLAFVFARHNESAEILTVATTRDDLTDRLAGNPFAVNRNRLDLPMHFPHVKTG